MVLSSAVTCGANSRCSNQGSTRRETPVRERRISITAAKEFGSFAKQAHELPVALPKFLEQTKIRAMAQRARGSIRSVRGSTPVLRKHLLAGKRPAPRPSAFLGELAFSGFDSGSDLIPKAF